ncbi:MAG: SDR family NAD(P)-dependent oxidoreductase [Planctomycetota bacterium]
MIFSHKRISGTAVVTGAASGLGKAIALELARDGWRLAIGADRCTSRGLGFRRLYRDG